MTEVHDFCRLLLAQARKEAKTRGIELPKRITAVQATRRQFFVEASNVRGIYITADCAWDAKAKFIVALIDGAYELEAL